MMNMNINRFKKYIFAIGFSLLCINPNAVLSAESVIQVQDSKGATLAQGPSPESVNSFETDRPDDNSLQSERRFRLQTVDNVVRSQQSVQRISIPRR